MTPLPLLEQIEAPQPRVTQFHHEWCHVLNGLRMIALDCRVAAQTDLFEACALLSNKQEVAQDAHARALLKCLRQAIRNKPVFFRPGSQEVSFDEAWLMRALMAAKSGDSDSFMFLLRSRVPKQNQRHVAFLIKGISERFYQV